VINSRELPNRKIYCLDLKASNSASDFIQEVKRIHAENAVQLVGLADVLNAAPLKTESLKTESSGTNEQQPSPLAGPIVNRIEDPKAGRRWYPVIDYSRCTNCMECIDFCLFGVYGVDRIDTILVEQPDNCRKGCPACSRVCPENAIMFPQHKTPAIAGSMDAAASLKIDLSQLFGAPADGKSAEELAAMERDEQLVMAGRDAVGHQPSRRSTNTDAAPKDDLDDLVDELNDLDL
jgi:NAD-dependent dihydropyrimidine dehydrogenase PreA subunit